MNLTKQTFIKTLAGACALLSSSTYVDLLPVSAAVVVGILGVFFGVLSTSPIFVQDATPLFKKVCMTVAAVAMGVAGSTYFTAIQNLVNSEAHPTLAHKLAVGVTLLGAFFGWLANSPIAGGTGAAAAKVALLALCGSLAFGSSGCATVQPIVKDIETCAGPAGADIATKILPAAEVILECELATAGASLPACAENGLAALAAAAGPDGWRIVACVVNAIEKDATEPPGLRARARLARPVVAMHRALNR